MAVDIGRGRGERRRTLLLLGPAFVAAIAYVDPGNVAANVTAGAKFGYLLVWVLIAAGGVLIGVVSMLILAVQARRGQRTFETVIMALLAVIAVGFVFGLVVRPPSWSGTVSGIAPRLGGESLLLAASMLGATVMPHAIYLHSALARGRHGTADAAALPRLLRATRWDVLGALAIAGAVNLAMLLLSAANLAGTGDTASIEAAHRAIHHALGSGIVGLIVVLAPGRG